MTGTEKNFAGEIIEAPTGATTSEGSGGDKPRKSSGYRRLQVRHKALIAEQEALQNELFRRVDENAELRQMYQQLQVDVEAVLAENAKLIEALQHSSPGAGAPPPLLLKLFGAEVRR